MAVTVSPATPADDVALKSPIQLYAYDVSEHMPLDVGEDGLFDARSLETYGLDAGPRPFLLRVDGKLAGFALVEATSRLTGEGGVLAWPSSS